MSWKWWLVFAQWLPVTPLWYGVDTVGASNSPTGEEKRRLCDTVSGVSGSALRQPAFSLCLSGVPPLLWCCFSKTQELVMVKEQLMTHNERPETSCCFLLLRGPLRFESCSSLPTSLQWQMNLLSPSWDWHIHIPESELLLLPLVEMLCQAPAFPSK